MYRYFMLFLVLVVVATFALAAGGHYGSLAIDRGNGSRYGFAYNHQSWGASDARAISECGSGCSVVLRFVDECAAYAADQGNGSTIYGWGTASSMSQAQNRAMQECSNQGGTECQLRVWACSQ